jgi:HK97 gp10 family phage protein
VAEGIEIRLEGFEEINRKLNLLKSNIREQVIRKALRQGAWQIAAEAKRKVRAANVYDTGSTQKGIAAIALRSRAGMSSVTAKVGVRSGRRAYTGKAGNRKLRKGLVRDPFYWWFHELGTDKISARPFMQPALPSASQKAIARIRTVAERELAKLVTKGAL